MRKLIPPLVVFLVRTLARTLRYRVEDRCGITQKALDRPVIWAFWHNRILGVTIARERFTPERYGSVLTSPSRDGAMLADVMARFGLGHVRGSSSRRGGVAVRELISVLGAGDDVAITPDGPRGPVYKLAPGIVKLAQVTGTPVMPVHIQYGGCWELRSWDRFRIPKPFSRVTVIFGALHQVSPNLSGTEDAAFEAERLCLEELLLKGAREHPSEETAPAATK